MGASGSRRRTTQDYQFFIDYVGVVKKGVPTEN